MNVATIFKLVSLALFWAGASLFFQGLQRMSDSGFSNPKVPIGWLTGIFWITISGIGCGCWLTYITVHVIDQKCNAAKRWSTIKILTAALPILGAACMAVAGTYITWQHPYRLGECDCSSEEWGPHCQSCECGEHGICDSGSYGTGL
jgi:hypothetical protein